MNECTEVDAFLKNITRLWIFREVSPFSCQNWLCKTVSVTCCLELPAWDSAAVLRNLSLIAFNWMLRTHMAHNINTHPFNGPFSGTTQVSQYQKGKTYLDFTEARDSEWHWLQLGHVQVCTSLQTDNHASTPPLRFLQAGCPSCRPTNSVKALKAP